MHEQAFHTCCRRGLTAQPGFQYNAASPGLSQELLNRLAPAHAGYQAPRDAPAEPTPAELGRFPISLRCRPVEGAGPVLSRTAYVGREFRGDGESDTGRFGNYFSHMVMGGDAAEPFDGLLPIELWEAEHWSTRESPEPVLQTIAALSPGPLDLERALAELLPDRGAWIPEVVSATVAAIGGGPRVVLVEEAGPRAAAWVAVVCFALPRALAGRLTFSTFEGRPRYTDLQLVLTTPGCDVAFPTYELGQRVSVLDAAAGTPAPERSTLLGRAIGALAEVGAEALSATVRAVQAGACEEVVSSATVRAVQADGCEDPVSLGAAFAILAGRCDLAQDEADVVEILRLLAEWHEAGRAAGRLGAAAGALAARPEQPSEPMLAAWWRLYAVARGGGHAESAEIVDVALGQLLANLDRLQPTGALVSGYAPVRPSVARLAEFLDGLQRTDDRDLARADDRDLAGTDDRDLAGTDDRDLAGSRVAAGWQLGLVGSNDELDRRFAAVMADQLDHPAVQRSLDSICLDPRHRELVFALVAELLERATRDPDARSRLSALVADQEIAAEALSGALRASKSFDVLLAGARVWLPGHPHSRRAFVGRLVALAGSEQERDMIRGLYGSRGPVAIEDRVELLDAYAATDQVPPAKDLLASWQAVASRPLRDPEAIVLEPLVQALTRVDPEAKQNAAYVAFEMFQGGGRGSFEQGVEMWVRALERVASHADELPADRYKEFAAATARRVLSCVDPDEHCARFAEAAEILGKEKWRYVCESELAGARPVDAPRVLARLFETWDRAPRSDRACREMVLESLLPAALDGQTADIREHVAAALSRGHRDRWSTWSEAHPPRRTAAGRIGRLRRRGERSR
jgi:hypothetical protein